MSNLYWLPEGSSVWQDTGIIAERSPVLSKSGLLLATLPPTREAGVFQHRAGYFDLNSANPQIVTIPPLSPQYEDIYLPADADSSGRIVITQLWGDIAAIYQNGIISDLSSYFDADLRYN